VTTREHIRFVLVHVLLVLLAAAHIFAAHAVAVTS
jgi:hypothetical protein